MAKNIKITPAKFVRLCREGSAAEVRDALKNGAELNSRNHAGYTPLTAAVENNRIETVRLLIDAGADVNMKYTDSRYPENDSTPLIFALNAGNNEMIRLLLEAGAGHDEDGSCTEDALICAVALGAETLRAMLDAGADPDKPADDGSTALMFAARTSSVDILRILIEAGADVDARTEDSFTPLMAAVWGDKAENVKFLIDNGADVDAEADGDWGKTALIYAVESLHPNKLAVMKALLDGGANVNAAYGLVNNYAAAAAADNADLPALELLLSYGADVSLYGWANKNVLEYVREKSLHRGPEILKRLESITKS